jgi:hypothetical protein
MERKKEGRPQASDQARSVTLSFSPAIQFTLCYFLLHHLDLGLVHFLYISKSIFLHDPFPLDDLFVYALNRRIYDIALRIAWKFVLISVNSA